MICAWLSYWDINHGEKFLISEVRNEKGVLVRNTSNLLAAELVC